MKLTSNNWWMISLVSALLTSGCTNNGSFEILDETGQEVGETMASIDESGGVGGTIAMNLNEKAAEKMFKRISPKEMIKPFWKKSIVSEAHAASCFGLLTFGQCENNVLVRTFDQCTGALGATWDGTVTLTWGETSVDCGLQAVGDHISRDPLFTITGLRNSVFSVSKTGEIGQRLTWVSGESENKVFEFTNDGIRRTLTTPGGATRFDFTNTVTEPLTVTGATRLNRVVDGGVINVQNNLEDVSCDFTPSQVTWNSDACNCAVSGTWTGTCSDGKAYEYTITGCGTANYTVTEGSDVKERSLEFDRCIEL